jgi:hypothetical protein
VSPTSSSEPSLGESSPEPATTSEPTSSNDGGGTEAEEKKPREKIKHKGFIFDVRLGAIGCTKKICKSHDADPGFRIDGLIGRNFLGFVDVGLAGGFGTMKANVAPGTDGLSLYGLDASQLPPEAAALMFDQFTVDGAKLQTIQGGLDLRVHFIPRGRFDPYVGVGVQYTLFRGVYDTPGGRTKLGFHGLAFPIQAGLVVFAHRLIGFGAQFDYLPAWYGGISVRGAPGKFAAPIPAIKDVAAMAGIDLPGDLPHFWTVGGVVHIRLGK